MFTGQSVKNISLTLYKLKLVMDISVILQFCAVVEGVEISSKISIMDALHTNLFVIEINFILSILMHLEKRWMNV